MKKSTLKIINILAIILCVIMTSGTILAANDIQFNSLDNGNANVSQLQTYGAKIVTVIRNVGIVLAVIMLMVIGLKYMMGSAEEKAEYKKTLMPYLIGAVLLFAASGIAQMIKNFIS